MSQQQRVSSLPPVPPPPPTVLPHDELLPPGPAAPCDESLHRLMSYCALPPVLPLIPPVAFTLDAFCPLTPPWPLAPLPPMMVTLCSVRMAFLACTTYVDGPVAPLPAGF